MNADLGHLLTGQERVGNFRHRPQHALAISRARLLRLRPRRAVAGAQTAALEHRTGQRAAHIPQVAGPSGEGRQLGAGAPEKGGEPDLRKEICHAHAHVCRGGHQLLLGRHHVGPAPQEIARQTGGHFRRQGWLVKKRSARHGPRSAAQQQVKLVLRLPDLEFQLGN